jgi:hypothetical protein
MVSERWACRLLGQCRGTQRYTPIRRIDEDGPTVAIVALASHHGRYGYRRITALLNEAGFKVGKDRVQRIWRRERLKVPHKQRPRGRLWLNDGSCVIILDDLRRAIFVRIRIGQCRAASHHLPHRNRLYGWIRREDDERGIDDRGAGQAVNGSLS